MDVEERLTRLENAIKGQERLNQLEQDSIRFTAFLLLQLSLVGLIAWSVFHLVKFVLSVVKSFLWQPIIINYLQFVFEFPSSYAWRLRLSPL